MKGGHGHTVLVPEERVQVNGGIDILAALVLELGNKDVLVVDTDVLGGNVEAHNEGLGVVKEMEFFGIVVEIS